MRKEEKENKKRRNENKEIEERRLRGVRRGKDWTVRKTKREEVT